MGVVFVAGTASVITTFSRAEKSLEEVRRDYYSACVDMPHPLRILWSKVTGDSLIIDWDQTIENVDRHEKSLIQRGHLKEQTFVVASDPAKVIAEIVARWPTNATKFVRFAKATPRVVLADVNQCVVAVVEYQQVIGRARVRSTNIQVVTTPEDMSTWEKIVREADTAGFTDK